MFKLSTKEQNILRQAINKEAVYTTIVNFVHAAYDQFKINSDFNCPRILNLIKNIQNSPPSVKDQYRTALDEVKRTNLTITGKKHDPLFAQFEQFLNPYFI